MPLLERIDGAGSSEPIDATAGRAVNAVLEHLDVAG
jgi:hypothetical protein